MNNYKRNFFLTGGLIIVLLLLAFAIAIPWGAELFLGRLGHVGRNFCVSPVTWETLDLFGVGIGKTQAAAEENALKEAEGTVAVECKTNETNHCIQPEVCTPYNQNVHDSHTELIEGSCHKTTAMEKDYFYTVEGNRRNIKNRGGEKLNWMCNAKGNGTCIEDCRWK